MAYHASRKPPSIVKSVLNGARNSAGGSEGGWYPFDTAQGKALLGDVDLAFLGMWLHSGCIHTHTQWRVLSQGRTRSACFSLATWATAWICACF